MKAPKPESNFEILEEGSYPARIYSVVDLGTHSESFEGNDPTDKKKIRITWELPTEMKKWEKDGEQKEAPYSVGKEMTLSMGGRATLRKYVELMTTTLSDEEAYNFDTDELIGMECMVSIGHKDKKDGSGKYAFLSSVSRMPKGMKCPPQFNKSVLFNIPKAGQPWDEEAFQALPKFMREKIDQSMERNGKENRAKFKQAEAEYEIEYPTEDIDPRDIPFN